MKQQLLFTNNPDREIDRLVGELEPAGVFVIADSNTASLVLPVLAASSRSIADAKVIVAEAGDVNKNLDSLAAIWAQLNENGATRKSLAINVGGGMITDMGGFAAATFKRGMRFFNVPTTLLGAVDASVGGKTGINFNGCKNEVGVFAEPEASVISTVFFKTLSRTELLSGYAEMLKHGLLEDRDAFAALLDFKVDVDADAYRLLGLLRTSVAVKERIVTADPYERGIRRALNLGHTVGHAFESYAMTVRRSPVPHGYAVAWGLVVELVLSVMLKNFSSELLHSYSAYVREYYGAFDIDCDDYPQLLALMTHDKKNSVPDRINFSLLSDVGEITVDNIVDKEKISAALDIYRDLMGI